MSSKLKKTKSEMLDISNSIKEIDENLKDVLNELTPEKIKSLSVEDIKLGIKDTEDINEITSRIKETQDSSSNISDTFKDNPHLENGLSQKMGSPKQKSGNSLSQNRASNRPKFKPDDPNSELDS